jgi:hypothetical protein
MDKGLSYCMTHLTNKEYPSQHTFYTFVVQAAVLQS